MAIEELYSYDNGCDGGDNKPQWFKLWVSKYFDALDIENLDKDLNPDEKNDLFVEVGKAFISALFYFSQHNNKTFRYYKPGTRDGRILLNALKRDIDQSYREYYKRVADGKKGGRPPKAKYDIDEGLDFD